MSDRIVTNEGAGAAPVVLVVEDEALILMMLSDALDDAGFVVVEAGGADAAIAAFAYRRDISAVVTDLRMPGTMDGLGLARWMGEHVPEVPIIITSGFADRAEVGASNPAIARVVTKPYDPCDVVRWVSALVDRAGPNGHTSH